MITRCIGASACRSGYRYSCGTAASRSQGVPLRYSAFSTAPPSPAIAQSFGFAYQEVAERHITALPLPKGISVNTPFRAQSHSASLPLPAKGLRKRNRESVLPWLRFCVLYTAYCHPQKGVCYGSALDEIQGRNPWSARARCKYARCLGRARSERHPWCKHSREAS